MTCKVYRTVKWWPWNFFLNFRLDFPLNFSFDEAFVGAGTASSWRTATWRHGSNAAIILESMLTAVYPHPKSKRILTNTVPMVSLRNSWKSFILTRFFCRLFKIHLLKSHEKFVKIFFYECFTEIRIPILWKNRETLFIL